MNKDQQIWIANDHGGYELKLKFLKYFEEKNIPFKDLGSGSTEIVRYPYYAAKVAEAVSHKIAERGILICSTGIGMSVMANRYQGVRASVCTSITEARLTRQHNDSNVLCLGGKILGEFAALDILDVWLNTPYIGGRHNISLGLIQEAEETLCKSTEWIPKKTDL